MIILVSNDLTTDDGQAYKGGELAEVSNSEGRSLIFRGRAVEAPADSQLGTPPKANPRKDK